MSFGGIFAYLQNMRIKSPLIARYILRSPPALLIRLYRDGLKSMTWGRQLWILVAVKLFVIFVILRLIFFTPFYGDKTEKQKSEAVASQLIRQGRQ